jgi:subtilisin family serine protease
MLAVAAALGLAMPLVPSAAKAEPVPRTDVLTPTARASHLTLITGDVVEVTPAGGGRYAASVRPAPGREQISFHSLEADGGLRLLPSDVVPYVSSGVLDADLFDVQELLADGYGDASTPSLPLIVRYADASAGPRTAVGTRTVRALGSIGGAAMTADKLSLADFWRSVQPTGPAAESGRSLAGGIAQIWLDGRVRATLDRSVPQIGAPKAWKAGFDGRGVDVAVLDTGIALTHPDVSGKVKASRNFSDSPDVTDRHGHGTHVAATIAGTGAASGGSRKGVAPGAGLLVGKVLDDNGSGSDSSVIAGMEWAVDAGAAVVNMSLGAGPTDGTDPLSTAVDRLTAQSGTLFVVSAGNDGGDFTVGAPGAASAALTVGAVDRTENLAEFSSRGPRLGDLAIKPEITAPGVGIVAARAGGTSMGTPVDEHYTAASGTSMAAPHVAGAAALLAQAHPDWAASALKDALVSTANPHDDLNVFEQGGGRVDVARAVGQKVHGTGVLNFGIHAEPAGPPVIRPVTYTNNTRAAVPLKLRADIRNLDTGAVDREAVTMAPDQVVVPAGKTVRVAVTFAPAKLSRGRHSGWITATGAGGVAVRTAVSATLDGPQHTVTLKAVDRAGRPSPVQVIVLFGEDRRADHIDSIPWGHDSVSLPVEEGTYALNALIQDGGVLDEQVTFITDPELAVTGDVEILLDARTGTPIRIETPRPAEQQAILSYYDHREHANGRITSHGVMHFSTVQQVNVTPTRRPSRGEYEFSSRWQLVAPMVQADVPGVAGPMDINLLHRSPAVEGPRTLPLVFARTGTPAELAAAGVGGAAALVTSVADRSEQEQVAAVAAAGAAVVIIVRPADFGPWTVWRPVGDREPIPAMVVANDDGRRMIARAVAGGAVIDLTLTVSSPYLYDVFHVERDRIPEQVVHRVTRRNTVQIASRYGENGGFGWAKEQRFGWRPWQTFSWNDTQRFVATPMERDEWVSAGDSVWQHRVHHYYTWEDTRPLAGGMAEASRTYKPDTRRTENWFTTVVRPAAVPGIPSQRTADTLALRVPAFVDATPGHFQLADWGDEVSARLWRGSELIAELPDAVRDVPTVAADAAYRLEVTTGRSDPEWQWATRTETAWEFRSARPANGARALPLLQVDYHSPADLSGRVSGRKPHVLGLALWHQDGLPKPRNPTVRLEVSFDEGATWRVAPVSRHGKGYRATIPAGTGSVSLRVRAADGGGSTVTQTVIRAYGLAG